MLHSNAHIFQSVHNQLHLPFQKNSSIQNDLEVDDLLILNDYDYPFYPRSGFVQIAQHISHRVVPERVFAFAALNAILFYIRYILAFRTDLLQANEI